MIESATEVEIVEGLQSEDLQKRELYYREVIRRYGGLVLSIARRTIGDASLAEDIFQEVFLRLFRSIHMLSEPKAFPGFLRRIILSVTYDYSLKKSKRKEEPLEVASLAYEFDTSYLDAFFILSYLNRLPEGQRKVIELEFFGGLDSSEIGKTLGINPVAARVRRYRALTKLRKWLIEDSNFLIKRDKKKGSGV